LVAVRRRADVTISHFFYLQNTPEMTDNSRMLMVLARLIALFGGWIAALATAVLAHFLLGTPEMPVLLASGGIWTCLLLLQ